MARLTADTIKTESEFKVDTYVTRLYFSAPLHVSMTRSLTETQRLTIHSTFIPSSDQRRKHQLSYLVYDAKMKEQQLNEKRREAARTKNEVKAKYGW